MIYNLFAFQLYRPQLTKYMIELMLSVKDYDNSISLEDLESMLDIVLLREEFQCKVGNHNWHLNKGRS